jgi:DNA-binding transcriptional regulator YhcF (GntR family)
LVKLTEQVKSPRLSMQITLSKNSDVPLRQQLAEQIVFLITTGELRAGEELPSVRAMARRVNVHHNTVSEAYQDLVRRDWLTRKRGSRLIVGAKSGATKQVQPCLDTLINDTIQRARKMGYSLQALREHVSERLAAQPPDHILVVEDEAGLRELIRRELQEQVHSPVETCSWQEFARDPSLAIGAQVLAPNHIVDELKQLIPPNRPPIPISYCRADEHVNLIRRLKNPSIIAVVSVSESLLKTARGLFAAVVMRKHTYQEILISGTVRKELKSIDLVFCDSIAMPLVNCSKKIPYRLIGRDCFDLLFPVLGLDSISNGEAK